MNDTAPQPTWGWMDPGWSRRPGEPRQRPSWPQHHRLLGADSWRKRPPIMRHGQRVTWFDG